MFSILLESFLRGAFEALFKMLFGLLGSLILKLSFGEKGLKVRNKLGKTDSLLFAIWIGFLPIAWIGLLIYLISSHKVECLAFLVAVPSIFSLWVFFSRKKIKRTLDENPAFLEDNNEYHIKRESLDKFYEKYGNGCDVKINTIPKEDLQSDIGKLYYKLKYDKFALSSKEMNLLIEDFTKKSQIANLVPKRKYKATFLGHDELNGILILNPSLKTIQNFSVYQNENQTIEFVAKPNTEIYYIKVNFVESET